MLGMNSKLLSILILVLVGCVSKETPQPPLTSYGLESRANAVAEAYLIIAEYDGAASAEHYVNGGEPSYHLKLWLDNQPPGEDMRAIVDYALTIYKQKDGE